MLGVEEEKEEMLNWIFYQTLTNSDREFLSEPHNKLKINENCIDADEFSFQKIKTFFS